MKRSAKPPSDHVRLARAFKIPPTRRGVVVTATSTFALIGALGAAWAFIPAAGVVAMFGGLELTDRRAIKRGLREIDGWGLPIEGYRAWLLADEPAFDVELRRAIDVQVIATSAAAIDPSIEVRRIDDRTFRVVTRRIALPGKDGLQPIYLGDRRLLTELHDRILAPLNADVGIVRMRMGDRRALSSLLLAPPREDTAPPAVEGMGAFRDQAMAAPPALQALVQQGKTSLSVGDDARKLRYRAQRVLFAAGRSPAGVGTVAAVTMGGLMTGAQFGPIGAQIGLVAGILGGVAAAIGTNRQNAKAVAALSDWRGFPIADYDVWLISGRPLFDIELRAPIDHTWLLEQLQKIHAFSGEADAYVLWVLDASWLEETRIRVETRPTLIHPTTSRIRPFYGGSHVLFQQFYADVLVPLHQRVGIRAVHMGGHVDRRV